MALVTRSLVTRRQAHLLSLSTLLMSCGVSCAAALDPAAVSARLLDQVEWKTPPNGSPGIQNTVLVGDPSQTGLYISLTKWSAGNHFSHPHFHPNDRFITVLKGTWWVGTGATYDLDATAPMRAGTFVTQYGKQVHFDGAKDEDAVLLIVGEGPATSTPVSAK
jgi:hypothetical protein